MGKGKPRYDPYKEEKYSRGCWCYESCGYCRKYGGRAADICKGNIHMCNKVKYRIAASRSDIQKANDVEPKGLFGISVGE